MSTRISSGFLPAFVLMSVAGCDVVTDAATRLAYDIKDGANRLGGKNGAVHRIHHRTPSASVRCTGPYELQLDKEAGTTLTIDLERRGGRAVVTRVR